MHAFRLCRSIYPPYDGEGARLAGGRWNSKGRRVLYMSENRSLAILEVLVHLSATIPDQYVLGMAEIPEGVPVEEVDRSGLPDHWDALDPRRQDYTRSFGDEWAAAQRSAVLSVPSVVAGERNFVLNPAHPEFARIRFADPEPFRFDARIFGSRPVRPPGWGQA